MILGSMEDERAFSVVSFIKFALCNRLDKNLENCIRLYVSSYKFDDFLYEEFAQYGIVLPCLESYKKKRCD